MADRALAIVACWLVLSAGCGPNGTPGDRCRQKPTFLVTIDLEEGVFPEDTRVSFEYGGGTETFELDGQQTPQIVFCETQLLEPEGDTGSAGAGGAPESPEIPRAPEVTKIVCELWTGGSTDVAVTATGFEPIPEVKLRPDRDLCTVTETITLTPEVD